MKRTINIIITIILVLTGCNNPESSSRKFNGPYEGDYLNRVAFPVGGIGAGMFCLEGNGCISHMSVRHKPEVFHEPFMFGAISVKGLEKGAKVLEGPVQDWKVFGSPSTGNGGKNSTYGFPRFENVSFYPQFPFAEIKLVDKDIPLDVSIKGWSPFIPTDADNSSLPVGALEYTFTNNSGDEREMVFSYNAANFMQIGREGGGGKVSDNTIIPLKNGYILYQSPRLAPNSANIYDKSVFQGLTAQYFDNMNLEGDPVVTRPENKVNMEWFQLDIPGVPSKMMSARWTGKIRVNKTAAYKMAVAGDDGYRLYINDSLIIDNWSDHGEQTLVKLVQLKKNIPVNFKLEFYQNQGGASIRFGYEENKQDEMTSAAEGSFAIYTDEPNVVVDPCWFKGGWFDGRTVLWKDIVNCNTPTGKQEDVAEGGSLFVPFTLKNGETKTIKLMFT